MISSIRSFEFRYNSTTKRKITARKFVNVNKTTFEVGSTAKAEAFTQLAIEMKRLARLAHY